MDVRFLIFAITDDRRRNLMCPICISAAAVAAMAGTGSAGGLAALVAVKLHIKPKSEKDRIERSVPSNHNLQPQNAGGGK